MTALSIRFDKKPDGSCVLVCTRPDGTATWQRHRLPFLPLHDLTHYAVETTLALRGGFYGLVTAGWDITDFGLRPLPEHAREEAVLTEMIVALMDQERATGIVPDASAFNHALAAALAEMDPPLPARRLTEAELAVARGRFQELAGRWARTPAGDALELIFEPGSEKAAPNERSR